MAAFFCFEGTAELPMGAEGFAAFSEADAVEHFFLITADAAAPSPIDGAETLGAALTGTGTTFEPVPTEATDTAIILPTSGTTRQAKGAELSHVSTAAVMPKTLRRLCVRRLRRAGSTQWHVRRESRWCARWRVVP